MMEAPLDAIIPELEGDEFLMWEARQPGRYELHHGFVVAFAGGSVAHATIALNLQILLRQTFPAPCRVFGSDLKIEIARRTYYYPDASVACEPLDDAATLSRAPIVVAEVLSARTSAYDRIEKRAGYRSLESLRAFLIVYTDRRRVEVDLREEGSWQTKVSTDGTLSLGETGIPLEELYAQTTIS